MSILIIACLSSFTPHFFQVVMAYIDFKELVSACVDLAEQAGTLIREVHSSGDLQVQIKYISVKLITLPLDN